MSIRVERHGGLGTGKTTGLVLDAVKYSQDYPERPIFCNIELKLPNFRPIDSARVLFEINEPAFVGLDELWHMADSRASSSIMNKVMSMLSLRSRKKGWMVSYTQQHWMQTDKRIRWITDLYIEPFLYPNGLYCQDVYTLEGIYIDQIWYDVEPLFDSKIFDTTADPYTLEIEDLKREYDSWKRNKTRSRRLSF